MKHFWRWIGGFVLVFAVTGILLPSRAHVEREILIDAHRATVFSLLNDFHQVNEWSPRLDDDPNARVEFAGPPRGVDASFHWNGQIIGQGHETITESVPYEHVTSRIDLGGGKEAHSIFTLSADGEMTRVVWAYERDFGINIAGRYFALMLESIVGPEYEKGLARLAGLAENMPRADFSNLEVEQIYVEAIDIAYLTTTSLPVATAISEALGDAYFEIQSFIDDRGLAEAGAPLSVTRTFSGSELVFDAAIPVRGVADDIPASSEGVKIGATYEGPVIRVRHIGSYSTLGRTHDKIAAYLAALGIERNGDAWESYISDPTRTSESELLTYVYYPIRN
jgi:effector-binding domain-containing protein/uncharacterized protein YndB with AHSA1/START domain